MSVKKIVTAVIDLLILVFLMGISLVQVRYTKYFNNP